MKKLFYFLLPFIASSCVVFNSGNVSSGPLLNVTDRYVDIARGEAENINVLWIFGTNNNSLVLDAKTDLFKNRPLREGEYYANFTCDFSKKVILGLLYTTRVTVSAEVIRIQKAKSDKPVAESAPKDTILKASGNAFNNAIGFYNPKNCFVNQVDSFFMGEKVYYADAGNPDFALFEITSINGPEVSLKPAYGKSANIVVPCADIAFTCKKPLDGFEIGDKVKAKIYLGTYKATVVATSRARILVRTEDSYFMTTAAKLKKLN